MWTQVALPCPGRKLSPADHEPGFCDQSFSCQNCDKLAREGGDNTVYTVRRPTPLCIASSLLCRAVSTYACRPVERFVSLQLTSPSRIFTLDNETLRSMSIC